MGIMVSRGMLWARKSCQAQYCSKVSQSKLWTEQTEKRHTYSHSVTHTEKASPLTITTSCKDVQGWEQPS